MKTKEIGLDFISNFDMSTKMVDDILSHYGVKGMHWGVRRERIRETKLTKRSDKEAVRREHRVPSPVRVMDTIGRSRLSKTRLKAVGGEDHPASPDAIKVAVSQQKLKKSGIHTLSNAELQTMAQRMNLESQVRSLSSRQPKSLGQGFLDSHLKKAAKDPFETVSKIHKFGKAAKKTAATAAVTAALA